MMTNKCMKIKNVKLLSIFVSAVLAIAIAIGVICGVQGFGVFNKSALLKDSNTLTVSLNQHAYLTKMEDVENYCEEAFDGVGVSYVMKGEMSGDESEIVYVFNSEAELKDAKAALETKFNELIAGDWNGTFITISVNSENAVSVLAKGYILRGIIAAVVLAVVVCAYVMLRYNVSMGITAGVGTALGALLTAALAIITRIPVTASVAYVIASGALLTAVMMVMTFAKLRANAQTEEQTNADYVANSVAVKEISLVAICLGVALVLVGGLATATVRWFAVLALISVLVATFIGLVYAPALYLPLKEAADKKPNKDGYIGAEKTSTKIKKLFQKKEKVVIAPVVETEEPVEAIPVEEAEEETVEEIVEEPAEETAEEIVEETEEVEEATEEAPATEEETK